MKKNDCVFLSIEHYPDHLLAVCSYEPIPINQELNNCLVCPFDGPHKEKIIEERLETIEKRLDALESNLKNLKSV